jgi:hypothetical protein
MKQNVERLMQTLNKWLKLLLKLRIENKAYALYLDTVNRNPVLTPEQKKEAEEME